MKVNKSKRFDLQDENLINSLDDICMTKTNSQKGKDIIYSIKKDLDKISPTKMNNVTQEKALDLHFFFDIENYVYLDFKKTNNTTNYRLEFKSRENKNYFTYRF